jgi:FAD/FMN-containing dehydrogenase
MEDKHLAALRSRFRGALLRPGEEGYDEARRVWNGAVDRHPALVARSAGADDVQRAVRFAREHGLPLSVRGGGHSVAGYGVRDDGLVLDVSGLKAVSVDPVAKVARGAGGLTWGELDLATQRHGLATTAGSISSTGVAGVMLCGGYGHLMRKHGLSVDNLRAADLVTADGDLVRVDAHTDPELLWGLRGGGGNFGVVTAFELDLHPVGPMVLAGPVFWPLDQAPAVLRRLRELAPAAPDALGIAMVANMAPPLPFLPPERFGTPVFGLLFSWTGDPAEGAQAIAPFRDVGTPIADAVRPMPYRALQSMLDGSAAPGNHAYWRSHHFDDLSDGTIDAVMASAASQTSPLSLQMGWVLGGAMARVPAYATAMGARSRGFELQLIAVWPPSQSDGERHRQWVLDGWTALRPHAAGQLATFLSDEGEAGVQAAYGDRMGRLVALKDRVDPTNLFNQNVNITPTTTHKGAAA